MQTLYVGGGVLLGAGLMGAASLAPQWGWAIFLGAVMIIIAAVVDTVLKNEA